MLLLSSALFSSVAWDKEGVISFLAVELQKQNYTVCSYHDNLDPPYIQMQAAECFSSKIILDLLLDVCPDFYLINYLVQEMKELEDENGLYCFFSKKGLLPPDVDSTAFAHVVLAKMNVPSPSLVKALDTILLNVNQKGIIEVYCDSFRRGRIDPVVCANALYFIHFFGYPVEATITEEFIYTTLSSNLYADRMRYYPNEETFLYFISRLLQFPNLKNRFFHPLNNRLNECMKIETHALNLAMRIICAKKMGRSVEEAEIQLANFQDQDGGWPICPFFKNGTLNQFWGSRAITTAFAICALSCPSNQEN